LIIKCVLTVYDDINSILFPITKTNVPADNR
jgi:hypothetical protein